MHQTVFDSDFWFQSYHSVSSIYLGRFVGQHYFGQLIVPIVTAGNEILILSRMVSISLSVQVLALNLIISNFYLCERQL